jgi:LmbE family N-acetylglucosaminyl deacetylase
MTATVETHPSVLWPRRLRRIGRTASDVAGLLRHGHRWPSADEHMYSLQSAQLARLCGDDPHTRPSVLLVVAHADDETFWSASRLFYLRDLVTLVYVTDSAPDAFPTAGPFACRSREAFAALRRRERDEALAIAGIAPHQVLELGHVDQQARDDLAVLTAEIGDLVDGIAPEVVLTHAYESGHPDHDATACAVHFAVRARQARNETTPALLEFAGYNRRFGRARSYRFLPARGCDPCTVVLDEATRRRKRSMCECFRSQRDTLPFFPVEVERFRCAPRYDFDRPANWEAPVVPDA